MKRKPVESFFGPNEKLREKYYDKDEMARLELACIELGLTNGQIKNLFRVVAHQSGDATGRENTVFTPQDIAKNSGLTLTTARHFLSLLWLGHHVLTVWSIPFTKEKGCPIKPMKDFAIKGENEFVSFYPKDNKASSISVERKRGEFRREDLPEIEKETYSAMKGFSWRQSTLSSELVESMLSWEGSEEPDHKWRDPEEKSMQD